MGYSSSGEVSLSIISKAKKELILLAGTIFIVLLGELLIFNRAAMLDRFSRLRERRYTVHDGVLYQMNLRAGKLVVQGPHPSITFKNIDLPVDRISVTCKNSIEHEWGQVFFRAANEDFTLANSISYDTSTNTNTRIIDLPDVQLVSDLRFDLTHSENDVVLCKEFVINPLVRFDVRFRRVVVYMAFVLLAAFEVIKKLSSKNENLEDLFPFLSFQRLATPLLAVCLVFPDVVFLGASLRITDQVYGNHRNFPPISFYPRHSHHIWNAGMSDYFGALFQSEPMMEFMARSLREGESPYWNPYSAAGSLGPETLVDNKFSVFTLTYAFLGGGQKIYNSLLLVLYFQAAYFTYGLIREKLQLSFLASLAGTFFFLLNGFAVANVGSIPIVENLRSTDTVSAYSDRGFIPLSWAMIPSVFSSSHFFESHQAMEQAAVDYAGQTKGSNRVYHFGTTALLLATCSISVKRRKFSLLALVCTLAILIGFGRVFGVPGISSLISKIPVISYMIADRYWWPVMQIPLIFSVALGVDNWQKRSAIPGLPFILLALLVGSLIAVGISYGLREPNVWYKSWSISLLLATAVVVSLAATASAYTSRAGLRNYIVSALVILAFVEMTMDSKTLRYASEDLFANPPTEITFLQQRIGLYRTLTIGVSHGLWHELGSAFSIQEVTAINLGTLSNYMDYFHAMVSLEPSQRRGYNYYPSLATMQDTPDRNTIHWTAIDLLGIKYIITPRNFSQYRQAFLDQDLIPALETKTAYVYQNPRVFPRAFTIDQDSLPQDEAISLPPDALSRLHAATITLYRNNDVVLNGTVTKPSLVVLTDNWHSNWTAFVNEEPTEILPVYGTFRGVPVLAGTYEVRFHYQPRTLKAAIFTSGLIIVLLVYLLLDFRRIDRFLTTRFAPRRL